MLSTFNFISLPRLFIIKILFNSNESVKLEFVGKPLSARMILYSPVRLSDRDSNIHIFIDKAIGKKRFQHDLLLKGRQKSPLLSICSPVTC